MWVIGGNESVDTHAKTGAEKEQPSTSVSMATATKDNYIKLNN